MADTPSLHPAVAAVRAAVERVNDASQALALVDRATAGELSEVVRLLLECERRLVEALVKRRGHK